MHSYEKPANNKTSKILSRFLPFYLSMNKFKIEKNRISKGTQYQERLSVA
jgi:hypothetical protein